MAKLAVSCIMTCDILPCEWFDLCRPDIIFFTFTVFIMRLKHAEAINMHVHLNQSLKYFILIYMKLIQFIGSILDLLLVWHSPGFTLKLEMCQTTLGNFPPKFQNPQIKCT